MARLWRGPSQAPCQELATSMDEIFRISASSSSLKWFLLTSWVSSFHDIHQRRAMWFWMAFTFLGDKMRQMPTRMNWSLPQIPDETTRNGLDPLMVIFMLFQWDEDNTLMIVDVVGVGIAAIFMVDNPLLSLYHLEIKKKWWNQWKPCFSSLKFQDFEVCQSCGQRGERGEPGDGWALRALQLEAKLTPWARRKHWWMRMDRASLDNG